MGQAIYPLLQRLASISCRGTGRAGLWTFLMAAITLQSRLPYPHPFFVLYCFHIRAVLCFNYLIIHACLGLRFPDMKTNPGARRPVPDVSRILCSDVREPVREPQWSRYNIVLWFETFGSVLVPAYIWWPSLLLCLGFLGP